MPVRPHRGRVDEHATHLAELGIRGHGLEQPSHRAGVDPAAEAVVDGIPTAELAGEVAQSDAGAAQVKQGFEKQTVGENPGPPLWVLA